jgi:hypothetical protein
MLMWDVSSYLYDESREGRLESLELWVWSQNLCFESLISNVAVLGGGD